MLLDRNGLSSVYEDRSTESAKVDFGEFAYEDEHPAQPSAQPNTLEELREKLWRTTTQNEVLSAEVLRLRSQLSFYHDALRVSAAARAARDGEGKGKGKEKWTDAKEPSATSPQSSPPRAERETRPTPDPGPQTPAIHDESRDNSRSSARVFLAGGRPDLRRLAHG